MKDQLASWCRRIDLLARRLINSMPRSLRLPNSSIRWVNERPVRSNFQTTEVSPGRRYARASSRPLRSVLDLVILLSSLIFSGSWPLWGLTPRLPLTTRCQQELHSDLSALLLTSWAIRRMPVQNEEADGGKMLSKKQLRPSRWLRKPNR
jgi:hypothetical protein